VGPNAFTLLNRAAGLKQLNSIDEIFRELVLDDHSAFDDAQKVADGFAELASIHAELELANRQYVALLPLRDMARARRSRAALPHWFAQQGLRLWSQRRTELQATLDAQAQHIAAAQSALDQARSHEHTLLETYLRAGGGDIKSLEQLIQAQQNTRAQRQKNRLDCAALLRNLGLDATAPLNAQVLAHHQQRATAEREVLQAQQRTLQDGAEVAVTRERNAHAALQELQAELQAVRQRPDSNLPSEFTQFRAALSEQLQRPPDDLPFVAELVEVQKKQQAWRGAIERALGSHRLRILVPTEAMDAALGWVNQRHNRLHVRLLEVRAPATPVQFWGDGFAHKLNLKDHAYTGTLRQLLAEQDRHCVDNAEALRTTPHAMTQQGLMSGKAQHFDKQDQRRIDQDWMTGFDNRDRLAHLEQQISEQTARWETLQKEKLEAQSVQGQAAHFIQLWTHLQTLQWDDLDADSVQAQLHDLQARLAALLDPQCDTAHAKLQWEAAQNLSAALADALLTHQQKQAGLQERHATAQARQAGYAELRSTHGADTTQWNDAIAALLTEPPACDLLERQERHVHSHCAAQIDKQTGQLTELHKDIIRQMAKAQKEDRGALAEELQEVAALTPYLERLRVLSEEDLPAKRQRFQDYLNSASDQGVSTLLSGIEAQVAVITERIDQLNETLARVDFQQGRYLQLDPQPVIHPFCKTCTKPWRNCAANACATTAAKPLPGTARHRGDAANPRQQPPQQGRASAAGRPLPPAVCRAGARPGHGQMLERRTGSQGGSGGEKEIIASYVLTASLSYALCRRGQPPGVWHHRAGRGFLQKLAGRGRAHHPGAARVWSACAVRHAQQGSAPAAQPHAQRRGGAPARRARPRWHRCAGRSSTPARSSAKLGIKMASSPRGLCASSYYFYSA
jgi:uncharacterized protein YPO0396